MSPLTLSTHAQDFGEQSIKQSFPVETHPRVSEKDYKAALEKIPAPAEKCDPWGNARSAEPTKPGKKSN
ncbi:hypothetical protein [Bradyrhizobium sp. ARR65]|uniref:hypothetical protein n=1 Tax=Bradyrhizobium sp. ARR65 TaxID=1040989 RepID=UPI0004650DBC|nr:hypothetical protein [Bradyrhizobium sp. ARR65]